MHAIFSRVVCLLFSLLFNVHVGRELTLVVLVVAVVVVSFAVFVAFVVAALLVAFTAKF